MTDGERRFIRQIAEQIAPERITEVHQFPSIRQGAFETGVAVIAVAEEATTPDRYAVFTARYRLAIKGTDRGAWTFDLRPEADAPLDAIASVVRGVERRIGDPTLAGAARLDGDAFRALLYAEAKA